MMIHVPTLMLAILVLSTMLCLSVGWVSWREGGHSLRALALALGFHTLGYFTFFISPALSMPVELFVRNFSISGAFALMIFALADFYGQPVRRRALFLVALGNGTLCMWLINHLWMRLLLSSTVSALLDLWMLRCIQIGQRKRQGRAHILVTVGVVINLLLMIVRAIGTLTHANPARSAMDSTLLESALYLSALVSLNLVAVGFVLMTKEASDEALRQQATTDRLTGVWNRARFEDEARQKILHLRRYGTPLSLLLLDIDHFKLVNDIHGHLVGDAVLKEVVARTRLSLRETDIIGRWGGEEFVLLLPSTGLDVAVGVAERIRAQIADKDFAHEGRVTVSIGVASCRVSDELKDLFDRADAALYRAKNAGRNCIEIEVPLKIPTTVSNLPGVLKLVWSDALATGYTEMDTQHRQLFEAANQLLDLSLGKHERQALHAAIFNFMNQLAQHLKAEEALLIEIGWERFPEHIAHHHALLARSQELLAKYEADALGLSELLHFIVYEVTAQHILIEDLHYRH